MKRHLAARLAVVIGVGIAVVAAAMIMLALAIQALRSSAGEARHSQEVVATSTLVQLRVLDAETSVRGYAITGRASYLAPLYRAQEELPEATARLRTLTADDDRQAALADELGQRVQDYLSDWAAPLSETAPADTAAARRTIAGGEGKRRVDVMRVLAGRLIGRAREQAAERQAAAGRRADRALAIAGVTGLAMLAVGAALLAYLQRTVARPLGRAARAAVAVGAGDLDQRLPGADREDELGRLAATFNTMVDQLRASSIELEHQHAELENQNAELERQAVELERQAAELEAQARELERGHGELSDANARLRERGAELEQLATELRRAHERTVLFAEVAERSTTLETVPERAEVVLDAALQLSAGTVGAVWARHSVDDAQPALAAARGLDPEELPREPTAGAAARAIATGRPVVVEHGEGELRLRSFGRDVALRRELHLPVVYGGAAVGVLSIGCTRRAQWTPEERDALEHLAEQAGVFFDNAAQTQAVRWLADVNRSVLDATGDGIQLVGTDGRTILLNRAMREFADRVLSLGVREQVGDVPAGAIAEYVGSRTTDPERFRARWEEIAADPVLEAVDEYQFTESGRWFYRYTAPVHASDGRLLGRIFVIRETTEQHEAQRVKDELMATVSHELRTPLAAILGFTELLGARDYGEAERREYLQTIHRQASRLSALVDDFLDLQRLEAGGRPLELGPVDLGALLREETDFFSHQSARHRLRVELDGDGLELTADAARLRRAVANLLSNAIKYSPQGGEVTVTAARRDGVVEIAVSDEGIGVPEAAREQLFERFYRVDNSETSEIGGTGLGLALVREVAEAHGGSVGVDSVEGQGSRFWLRIPRGPASSRTRAGSR